MRLPWLISLIDGESWLQLNTDVKGAIYEGLLERNAQEVKSGAGQYFTPRPLIQTMVEGIDPQIHETICDPACGTGGFLLAAYDHIKGQSADRRLQRKLRTEAFAGFDLVAEVVRLAAMNMYLHGIGNEASPIHERDALARAPSQRWKVVLTNPPFGRMGAFSVIDVETGKVTRSGRVTSATTSSRPPRTTSSTSSNTS